MSSTTSEMYQLLYTFEAILRAFTLRQGPTYLPIRTSSTPYQHLYILDSSFNPPTRAHLSLALSAFQQPNARVLLLLATQNVDKPTLPAAFQDRLAMMHLLGPFDIALTKHARFLDKATTLISACPTATELTFLIGFDTLVRLLDVRYYPPSYHLAPLAAFFKHCRVRCTMRGEDVAAQRAYVDAIARGEREGDGCRREWAARIDLVEAATEGVGVSSTAARKAVRKGDRGALEICLTPEVRAWVVMRGLYE